ncbi:hypothetical protein N2152v2_002140 [Parachlorella kessleri]
MVNKPPTERLELLVDKNAKLAAQLDVQRRLVAQLEKNFYGLQNQAQGQARQPHLTVTSVTKCRVEAQQHKEERWNEALLCVNRLARGGAGATATGENTEETDASLLQQRNPFLAKLVAAFLPDSKQARQVLEREEDEEEGGGEGSELGPGGLAEIEGALRRRMAGTLEAAAQVLTDVEELRSRPAADSSAAATGTSAAADDLQPTSPRGRARGGSSAGGASRDGSSREAQLAALNNLLKAENNRLRDRALKDGHRLRQLANSLADREDELLVAKRKLAQVKTSPAMPAVPAAPADQQGAAQQAQAGRQHAQQGAQQGAQLAGQHGEDAAVLQRLLDKRAAEADAREEALMRAEREARDLRDRLAGVREAADRAKHYDQQRLALVNSELEKLAERCRELHRERDHLIVRMHDAQYQAEQGVHARRQLSGAEAHIADLEGRVAGLRAAKADLEAQLLRERSKPNSAALAEEMRTLLEALQSDNASLKAAAARQQGLADRLEAAQQQVHEWRLTADRREAELALATERAEQHKAAISAHADKENQWKERESDLRLFVEVTHTFVGDSREVAEVRAAEAKLREQVAELQAKLAGQPLQATIEALKSRDADLSRQVDALTGERAEQEAGAEALRRQLAELRQQLAEVKAESEEYLGEIEKVGAAYEDAQAQNARLLAALGQREEDQARLLAESAAAAQERTSLKEERDAAFKAAARAEDDLVLAKRRIAELEAGTQALLDELNAVKADFRGMAARCEAAIKDLLEREALLGALKGDMEAAARDAAQRAAERDAAHEEKARERQRAERLQEQLEEAQARLERARRSEVPAGAAERELQAECDALRKLINCNVCHQRQKDVVITKCWHMFCNECIRRNLETRHRKCPGCGTPFGQGDVKQFFWT